MPWIYSPKWYKRAGSHKMLYMWQAPGKLCTIDAEHMISVRCGLLVYHVLPFLGLQVPCRYPARIAVLSVPIIQ
jgi:hypothetical protein